VTDLKAVAQMVAEVEQQLGPIDLLVNNAGIARAFASLVEVGEDEWWRELEVNLRGPFLFAHAILPKMIARGRGRIINVASNGGVLVVERASAYCVSKAALIPMLARPCHNPWMAIGNKAFYSGHSEYKGDDTVGIIELFLNFHEGRCLPDRAIDRLFDLMSKEQMRCRPQPVLNSVAWNIWHMARAEDIGVNRFVANLPQVFDEDNWGERMRFPARHHGGSMPYEEVTAFNQQIELAALRSYYQTVRGRTVEVATTLTPEYLDEIPDTSARLRQLFIEGIVHPSHDRVTPAYPNWSRGEMLFHLAMTHNYGHMYEVCTLCSLLGIDFWG
jgi:hypothetical protein